MNTKNENELVQLNLRVPRKVKDKIKAIANFTKLRIEDIALDALVCYYGMEKGFDQSEALIACRKDMVDRAMKRSRKPKPGSFNQPEPQLAGFAE